MTASVKPISRFPVPELKNLPDDIREKIMAENDHLILATFLDSIKPDKEIDQVH